MQLNIDRIIEIKVCSFFPECFIKVKTYEENIDINVLLCLTLDAEPYDIYLIKSNLKKIQSQFYSNVFSMYFAFTAKKKILSIIKNKINLLIQFKRQ